MAEEIEKQNTGTKSDDDVDAGFSDEQLDKAAGGVDCAFKFYRPNPETGYDDKSEDDDPTLTERESR
jgi:hypothetical protein